MSLARLTKIGWTKLAVLAPHITGENLQQALLFAEANTVKNIEAVVHGLEPPLLASPRCIGARSRS